MAEWYTDELVQRAQAPALTDLEMVVRTAQQFRTAAAGSDYADLADLALSAAADLEALARQVSDNGLWTRADCDRLSVIRGTLGPIYQRGREVTRWQFARCGRAG